MKEMERLSISQVNKILTSPSLLKKFLKGNSISLKKRLGQNFLFDRNIINKIIKSMNLKKSDIIVEIGAGIGNITIFYLSKIKYGYLFEIDKGFIRILNQIINLSKAEIIHIDFLKTDLHKILDKEKKYKIFSNLPYSVASQIILKIIENIKFFSEIYIMVPEIIYKRMRASTGNKDYSKFSVIVQTFLNIENLFSVSRNSFFPVPEVDSVFLKLTPRDCIEINDIPKLKKFLNMLFRYRRKKIKKIFEDVFNLTLQEISQISEELSIDLNSRIQDISVETITKLFKKIIIFL